MTHGGGTTGTTVPGRGVLGWASAGFGCLVTTIIVVMLLVGGIGNCFGKKSDDKKPSKDAPKTVEAPAKQVVRTTTITKTVGKEKRAFHFSKYQSGCLPVTFGDDFEFYTFNGATITVQKPDGSVDTVPPNTDWRPRGIRWPATFVFCKTAPTVADSIHIWARWKVQQ